MLPDTWFQYFDVSLHVAQGEYLLVYDGQSDMEARRFTSDLIPIGSTIVLPPSRARVASNGVPRC